MLSQQQLASFLVGAVGTLVVLFLLQGSPTQTPGVLEDLQGVQPTPKTGYPLIPLGATDTLAERVATLARCLVQSTGFSESTLCWTAFKKAEITITLETLANIPELRYNLLDQVAHGILMPSHDCEATRLHRVGTNAYAKTLLGGANPGEHRDGPKWMCAEYLRPAEGEQCVVFSIGSNGDFSFEEAMFKFAPNCRILTFDCTGTWDTPSYTEFHPWCVGNKDETIDGREFKTVATIMRLVHVDKIHLLKIDVEGYEFPAFESFEAGPVSALPKQILVEVHFAAYSPGQEPDALTPPNAVDFYQSLHRMHYQIAHRERNIHGKCCVEYILIHEP